jgi:small ligand-binding sensory domain FIST
MGDESEREVAAIHEALGGVALSGFFSFGEIGPSARGRLAYYNQTAVLALLKEDKR